MTGWRIISTRSWPASGSGLNRIESGDRDFADVVEQEAELHLGLVAERHADLVGDGAPVRGDALGVLAGVGVAGLDRVGERPRGGDVGRLQLGRPHPLLGV